MTTVNWGRLAATGALCLLPVMGQAQPTGALPPVTVTADRDRDQIGPVQGWRAETSASATRTDTPLDAIPQTVQVLPRSLLEETGSRNLDEALRNAPQAVPQHPLYFNQTFNIRVRGFNAELYRDGMASFFDAGLAQQLTGIERVEVIAGPTGSLFGGGYGGGLGGLVNLVSRLPSTTNSGELGIRLGNFGLVNPWFDVNRAIIQGDQQVLLRFQGEGLSAGSHVRDLQQSGYNLQPAFTVRKGDTSLSFQGFFSRRDANDYPGLPLAGTVRPAGFSVDRFLNINGRNVPMTLSERNGFGVTLEHRLSPDWQFRMQARYGVSVLDQPSQALFGAPLAGSVFGRINAYLRQDLEQITLMPTLTGRFTTGPVRHTLLLGAEFDRVRDSGGVGFALSDLYDVTAPTIAPYVRPAFSFTTNNTYRTYAGFVQHQATLWDRLHLLGALRVSSIRIDSRDVTGTGFTAETTHVNPRVGAAFDTGYGVTLFAGYGSGVRANPYVTLPTGVPKPETAEQVEAGVRVRLAPGITGSAAFFDITRRNVAVADPTLPFAQRQSGERRATGADIQLLFQPSRALSVLLNYTYTDAAVTRDTVTAAGTRVGYVPRHAGRLWATYRFVDTGPEWLRGLSVGGGVTGASGALVEDGGPSTRGYVTYDAQIAYETGPVRVALTARNLANRRFFLPYQYLSGAVAPSAGREVFSSLSVRF